MQASHSCKCKLNINPSLLLIPCHTLTSVVSIAYIIVRCSMAKFCLMPFHDFAAYCNMSCSEQTYCFSISSLNTRLGLFHVFFWGSTEWTFLFIFIYNVCLLSIRGCCARNESLIYTQGGAGVELFAGTVPVDQPEQALTMM